jgi:two-component sensor histidine kinase
MSQIISTPRSANIKIALLIAALILVAGLLFYTQTIVERLQTKEREVADLYARSLEYIASGDTEVGDFSFIFDEIIKAIDFPIIISDANKEPIEPFSQTIKNVDLDTTESSTAQQQYLKRLIDKMDARTPPIRVVYQDTVILSHLHYGDSELITLLKWLPLIEISLAGLFIVIGYIGFSYIKRNEQSNIWVGMAKETAHQIGTPLSSMLGWLELLRENGKDRPELQETINEMEKDLDRLRKIAARFSKIGSMPDLKSESVITAIRKVIQYFERRLPQMKKPVDIILDAEEDITVPFNAELFEWVIENLIKNGLDAIEQAPGSITISVRRRKHHLLIDVTDTGKGIDKKYRKDIFRPGFSTKKRGWGLGLSLSKRIVENYHHGKLTIKESRPGEGTTFRIRLRLKS